MEGKKLNLFEGIALAIGSIIGSGILFLPSFTYQTSKSDVILVWVITTILCIPIFIFFSEMVKADPHQNGIEGFISKGLGEKIGKLVPVLLLSTVIIGMPCSAIIVSKFLGKLLSNDLIVVIASYGLLLFGIVTNYFGIKLSSKIQGLILWGLIAISIAVFLITSPSAIKGYSKLKPTFDFLGIFKGVVIAFWAFAGLENLTFIAKDFKNPSRDFFLSAFTALLTCGFLYILLTANYAAIIPIKKIESTMGLYQLSETIEPQQVSVLVITVFSFFCLLANFNSWVLGLSNMIQQSAAQGYLPSALKVRKKEANVNAIFFLAVAFSISLALLNLNLNWIEPALILVSVNFVVIYILSILAYARFSEKLMLKITALLLAIFLIISIVSFKGFIFYPIVVLLTTSIIFYLKNRKEKAENNVFR